MSGKLNSKRSAKSYECAMNIATPRCLQTIATPSYFVLSKVSRSNINFQDVEQRALGLLCLSCHCLGLGLLSFFKMLFLCFWYCLGHL